jgi:signal transduction histidine kinase
MDLCAPLKRRLHSAFVLIMILACLALRPPCATAVNSAERSAKDAPPSRLQSIESAIQAAGFSTKPLPVLMRGIVTSNRHRIVIEDRTGAVEVKLLRPEDISLGDEVEVSGKLKLAPAPQVEGTAMRRLWGGSMPLPLSITPDQAADGENEFFLVQTVAKLSDFAPAGLTGVRLNLRGGHQNFSAVLPRDVPDEKLSERSMQAGATLRLTGILIVSHGLDARSSDAFSLELRTPEDIELVEPPSWWTGAHVALLGAAGIILILLAISSWNHVQHSRYRAVAEERASIARDLHDTLAQGYAGITLQLEAAQQTIARDPERAGALLNEALQLVRHSRHESHLSIDILRSLSRNSRLDDLVSRCVQQMRTGSPARIDRVISGEPVALSYTMVNNLFRIVQEALANAVHHAGATTVVVKVEYLRHGVLIEVEDDGNGFDTGAVPGPEEGHFGLVGMRERCAAINAKLELHSAPGGTVVRVRAAI